MKVFCRLKIESVKVICRNLIALDEKEGDNVRGPYGRKDRLIKEKNHDSYQEQNKWPEPTLCSQCGALFSGGRWTWYKTLEPVNEAVCPACRRIAERFPAGHVEIGGPFYEEHQEEILNLIRNTEQQEKESRPLERIMSTTTNSSGTLILTTGIHLARRIGEALARAYQGEFAMQYAEAEQRIRVQWRR